MAGFGLFIRVKRGYKNFSFWEFRRIIALETA
jgi:hypothetical protein